MCIKILKLGELYYDTINVYFSQDRRTTSYFYIVQRSKRFP